MTRKCPTCGGDGIVYSEASAAIDVERRLRALAAGSRSPAFRVEIAAPIASALVGPGARRLIELEALTKKRFFFEAKPDTHSDHFIVLAEGKLADIAPKSEVEEAAELQVELVEVDRHDATAAVGKLDGLDVVVGDAASLVGKKVKIRIERVLDGVAYASLVRRAAKVPEPLTAEAEAEKPTRRPPARKTAAAEGEEPEEAEPEEAEAEAEAIDEVEVEVEVEIDDAEVEAEAEGEAAAAAKKKTRRGSRGGRKRKKPAAATAGDTAPEVPDGEMPAPKQVTIHVPAEDLGEEPEEPVELVEPSVDGAEAPAPVKKKTRRGSRGGKNRRKKPAAATTNGAEPETEIGGEPVEEPVEDQVAASDGADAAEPEEEWGYVPMSEWGDEFR
jgi:predicted RNA-binding protein with TRAM domain